MNRQHVGTLFSAQLAPLQLASGPLRIASGPSRGWIPCSFNCFRGSLPRSCPYTRQLKMPRSSRSLPAVCMQASKQSVLNPRHGKKKGFKEQYRTSPARHGDLYLSSMQELIRLAQRPTIPVGSATALVSGKQPKQQLCHLVKVPRS